MYSIIIWVFFLVKRSWLVYSVQTGGRYPTIDSIPVHKSLKRPHY